MYAKHNPKIFPIKCAQMLLTKEHITRNRHKIFNLCVCGKSAAAGKRFNKQFNIHCRGVERAPTLFTMQDATTHSYTKGNRNVFLLFYRSLLYKLYDSSNIDTKTAVLSVFIVNRELKQV